MSMSLNESLRKVEKVTSRFRSKVKVAGNRASRRGARQDLAQGLEPRRPAKLDPRRFS